MLPYGLAAQHGHSDPVRSCSFQFELKLPDWHASRSHPSQVTGWQREHGRDAAESQSASFGAVPSGRKKAGGMEFMELWRSPLSNSSLVPIFIYKEESSVPIIEHLSRSRSSAPWIMLSSRTNESNLGEWVQLLSQSQNDQLVRES